MHITKIINGSATIIRYMTLEPKKPQELLDLLETNNISCTTNSHKPVFTVEESKELRIDQNPAGHTKNLYLRDKKKRNFLVTVQEDKDIDLNSLSQKIGSKRFSFGSPDRLMEFLGVIPGAVSPLTLINDPEQNVEFWIDEDLLESEVIYCHPLDNAMTTEISPDQLKNFLEITGHKLNSVNI